MPALSTKWHRILLKSWGQIGYYLDWFLPKCSVPQNGDLRYPVSRQTHKNGWPGHFGRPRPLVPAGFPMESEYTATGLEAAGLWFFEISWHLHYACWESNRIHHPQIDHLYGWYKIINIWMVYHCFTKIIPWSSTWLLWHGLKFRIPSKCRSIQNKPIF